MKRSRYNTARKWLIFWTLFVGLGAVYGAACMLIDPNGKLLQMDAMLPYFKKLPFADILFVDYTFSGVALLIVNGITNLTAAVLLIRKKKFGVILGGVFGVTLMLWICIQFYMFPPNVLSTAYFIFGTAQAVTGYITYIFCKQEEFTVDTAKYKNIGTDKSRLVVFFSRMGYVKKIAYEAANRTGADIYEIKSTERTDGTLGFWWCGRYGMHRWDMPIENIGIDLSAYDEVTVCSPIWVFSLAAPIRAFLRQASGQIKTVSYILVHHTNGAYKSVAKDVDKLLGIEHKSLTNIRCRAGEFKVLEENNRDLWRDFMMKNSEETIGKLIDHASTSFIAYVDENGYPITKAMLKPRERKGIKTIWFSTNTFSNKVKYFKQNNKASVYFIDKRFFRGVSLIGTMEVLETAEVKERIWRYGDTTYYKGGVTDPDYCVLKFTAVKGRYYSNFKSEDFDIG